MSWLWVSYTQLAPYLPHLAFASSSIIVLILLRPAFLYYLNINSQLTILKEQVRIQKKILEEIQFLRFSSSKKMDRGEQVNVLEEDLISSSVELEEPIRIDLKKDHQ